ncbi:MAG: hypothetical protein Q7Q73_04645 [Verrucomicrobiota bacterium JB024]|nr:hypothetical protein [Verrucomicrobiota bacterium JB024]
MPILRASLLILLLLSGLAQAQEQIFHTFNLLDGRSISARIVGANGRDVILERADKLTFTLPVKSFRADDQERIRDWHIGDMVKKGTLVTLTGDSSTDDLKSQHEDGLITYSWWSKYKIKLTNDSPYDLEGLKFRYTYSLTQAKVSQIKTDPPAPLVSSEEKSLDLPSKQSLSLNYATRVSRIELEPGWTWPGGGDQPLADTLSPLEAVVTYKGQEVAKLTITPPAPEFKDKASTAPSDAQQ